MLVWPKKNISCCTNCSFVRLTLWPSLARWFKRVTVSATHVTSSRAQINKSSTYFNVFLPSSLFSPSVALMPFPTNRPKAAYFCSVALVTDSEAQSPLLSNTAAFVLLTGKLKAHTHFHFFFFFFLLTFCTCFFSLPANFLHLLFFPSC